MTILRPQNDQLYAQTRSQSLLSDQGLLKRHAQARRNMDFIMVGILIMENIAVGGKIAIAGVVLLMFWLILQNMVC